MREEYEETLMKQRNIFDEEIVELSEVKPVNRSIILYSSNKVKQYLNPGFER